MRTDPALIPYLNSATEQEAQIQLEALAHEAERIITAMVRRKLFIHPTGGGSGGQVRGGPSIEDLSREILVAVLDTLSRRRADPAAAPIAEYSAYVAAVAAKRCDECLRGLHRSRSRLKQRLRYLLTSDARFALWSDARGESICGLREWCDLGRRIQRDPQYLRLLHAPLAVVREAQPGHDPTAGNLADVVLSLFFWLGGPIAFDDLVNALSALWCYQEEEAAALLTADQWSHIAEDSRADDAGISARVVTREYLAAVWSEVRQLPPRQCTALLLNLRDCERMGVIALLPLLGIAGPTEIATAMGLTPKRLAEIWNDLPLEDTAIAAILGCTRSQVIGLRQSARTRLRRRLKETHED